MQGRLWLEKEDFNQAISSFKMAIKKGLKSKQKGQILIEMAIAHIQTGKYQMPKVIYPRQVNLRIKKRSFKVGCLLKFSSIEWHSVLKLFMTNYLKEICLKSCGYLARPKAC